MLGALIEIAVLDASSFTVASLVLMAAIALYLAQSKRFEDYYRRRSRRGREKLLGKFESENDHSGQSWS
jgi:hypothetical protein